MAMIAANLRLTGLALSASLLVACATPARVADEPLPPQRMPAPPTGGAAFQAATAMTLFDDVKARRVGDTLVIRLAERTQASKSAKTGASKSSTVDTGNPVLLGDTVTWNGDPILTNRWSTTQDFTGEGSSTQSNRLDGNVTVTVMEVYPNGNMRIQGEKWLTLNQGEEFVRVSGIVRPTDILPDNSVPSFKVADARIAYSGKGTLNDSNRPGILTRAFLKFWPL